MLLIAVAASAACFIWIVLDSTTADVFSVYGRMFRTAWQMKAWSVFASCGWRFLVIVGVIVLNSSLAYQATIGKENGADGAAVASWCAAVLLAFGLVPWTLLMRPLHRSRATVANAKMLREMATHLCAVPDLSSELVRAEYPTESGWDAWHPTSEDFQSTEGQKLWGRVVPAVYTSTEFPRTVVIPFDWSNFGVWGHSPDFVHSGEFLPFGGPGKSRFRAGSRVRRLEAAGDCWIVQAELDLSEDCDESSATGRPAPPPTC